MSNHIAGNWFVSVFKMSMMLTVDLEKIVKSENYRATTRRNAQLELDSRVGSLRCQNEPVDVPTCSGCGEFLFRTKVSQSHCTNIECSLYGVPFISVYKPS